MKILKKSFSLLMFSVLVLNLTMPASFAAAAGSVSKDYTIDTFTAKVNISVDKISVKPGDSFTMTLSVDNVTNADKVVFKKLNWHFAESDEKTAYYKVTGNENPVPKFDSSFTSSMPLGKKLNLTNDTLENYFVSDLEASLTFNVIESAEPTELTFTNNVGINAATSEDLVYFDPIKINIVDPSATDPDPEEATYTVSAKPSAESVYEGETFTVDVVAGADQDASLAAVDALIQYDKDLVKPVSAEAKAVNTEQTPTFYTGGSNGVTTDGTGRIYLYGSSVQTGTEGLTVASYTFEALKPGSASFSIADGAKIGISGSTADIEAVSGAAASVEIKEIPDEKYLISNADYKGAPDGKQVLKYAAKDMPADGNAYFYGEDASPLYYAYDDNDGKHVFLGFVDAALTNDTLADVTEQAGKYETLSYTGDINRNGSINAVDSLIAYDLATGVYSVDGDMSILTAQRRLEADINNDGKVTAADARAIMFKALGIDDPELAQ